MMRAGTSVRQVLTFSVIPSLSIMIMYAPAPRNRFAKAIGHAGSRVPSAFQLFSTRGAARAKLDSNFRLRFQASALDTFDQAQPVVGRKGNESAGYLDDVEAHFLAFANVLLDRLRTLSQHVLDESAGGDQHVMFVAELDQLHQRAAWHQGKGAAGEFERVDVIRPSVSRTSCK